MDRVADYHLPGVDTSTQGEPHTPRRLKLGVQLFKRAAKLAGAPHGPQRVVLVQPGDAEDRQHGVPDELLDSAAVPGKHLSRAVVVAGDHLPERLRVEPLAEPSGFHEITEDDCDGLADFSARGSRRQGRPATKTEPGPRRIVLPAPEAD